MADTPDKPLLVENVCEDDNWYSFACYKCGRKITLFYNGGELDHRKCCGYEYWLESRGTDFKVYPPVDERALD